LGTPGTLAALLVITVSVLAAFSGTLGNQLVDWDDEQLLITNDDYQGLSCANLRWMFTTGFGGHYQPLTWLSYAIETRLWGVNTAGFHFVNLLLHLATAITFYFVARRLLRTALAADKGLTEASVSWGALCATLLFAVHPLRVESVAWATERRDVLSGFWLMLSVWFYLRAVPSVPLSAKDAPVPPHLEKGGVSPPPLTRGDSGGWYFPSLSGSLLCFVLSLLSKATGMTLPVVLLLLDVYPLRRLRAAMDSSETHVMSRRVISEKLLFAMPAGLVVILAAWAQRQAGAMWSFEDHPLGLRISQAFYGIVFYLWKSVWPANLVPLYEQQPESSPLDPRNIIAAVLVFAFTIALWRLRRRVPALLTVWAAYIVLLSPMLGLAQSGPQLVADRYSYIACMPWAIFAGGFVAKCWGRSSCAISWHRPAIAAVLFIATALLIVLTRGQTVIWKDSYTLWTTTLERRPDTPIAHANLAVILNQRGEFERARKHALASLARLPGNRAGHLAFARAAMELGDLPTAERHLRIGIEIADAVGRRDPALIVSLATVLTRQQRYGEAEEMYRAVVALQPSVAEWHYALAGLLASRSRLEEAKSSLNEVLRLDPNRAEACLRLGIVLENLDDFAGAISALERGLQIDPHDVNLRAELAWLLATGPVVAIRNGPRALELARGAVADSSAQCLKAREALAAAFAETGDFSNAAATVRNLLEDPGAKVSEDARRRWTNELDRYLQRQPWTDARHAPGDAPDGSP
jgi:tetratricopeptide (TPR) repeat protein